MSASSHQNDAHTTHTPQSPAGDPPPSALRELQAAYRTQLAQLATERDEARRQARRAKAQADIARADLASLKARVHELLTAASAHLPALESPRQVHRPQDESRARAA